MSIDVTVFETDQIKKTKKNKKETVCSVKRRRYDGCGICGSQNIVYQGVRYCQVCGKEVDFIKEKDSMMYLKETEEPDCTCLKEYRYGKHNQKYRSYRPLRVIEVIKCADCGSVKGPFCPNCGFRDKYDRIDKSCWKHWDGRLFCHRCSFKNC